MTGFEPATNVQAGGIGGIGARETAGGETEPPRFRSYCFLKAFLVSHARALTPAYSDFVGISMLRQVSQSNTYAVEAIDLVKDFNETRAVDGVNLAVPTGSIYGLLGPNGAGKTTTLRMLIGIIDPSSGTR